MASQKALFSRTCSTCGLGSYRSFSTSYGLCSAAQVRWRWLVSTVHLHLVTYTRRNRDPHTGIQPRLPFLSRRQAPGQNPQFTYSRVVFNGLLKTRNGIERALGSRVLARFRVLVSFLRDDLGMETISSANQRRGLCPRGTLNQRHARVLRRGNNPSKALLAEMPKDE